MTAIDVGTLSLTLPERRLDSGDDKRLGLVEAEIGNGLREAGFTVVGGGDPYPEEDRLAGESSMMRRHCHTLMDFSVASVVLNVTAGARGGDVVECLRYLERELKHPVRFTLYADTARVPSADRFVLAASAALRRSGYDHDVVRGATGDVGDELARRVRFHLARRNAASRTIDVIARLKRQKLLVVGPGFDRTLYETVDVDRLLQTYGVNLDAMPLADVFERQREILGDNDPGDGASPPPPDSRVVAAERRHPFVSREQMATFYALLDLLREREAAAVALPGRDPRFTATHRFLGSPRDATGQRQEIVPAADFADVFVLLTRLMVTLGSDDVTSAVEIMRVTDGHIEVDVSRGPQELRRLGPVTLARLVGSRTGDALHVLEGHARVVRADGRVFVDAPVADDFPITWPAPTAALCADHHAAFFVELAERLGIGHSMSHMARCTSV